MKKFATAIFALASVLTACSDGSAQNPARVMDEGTRFDKEPVTMVTQSGITLTMKYAIKYHNHSSNKPSYVWVIDPMVFEVTGIDPASKARVVFTNFFKQTNGCGMWGGDFKESYYVDLTQSGSSMVGNLSEQGSLIGNDGKSYPATTSAPATRREPYCVLQQSTKQLVALVVDGVWQNAAEIRQNGQVSRVEGDIHDFELHLERY